MEKKIGETVYIEESNHLYTTRSKGIITKLELSYLEVEFRREWNPEWEGKYDKDTCCRIITQRFYYHGSGSFPIYDSPTDNSKTIIHNRPKKPKRVLATYKIEYFNGRIIQIKDLINQEDFETFYKPNRDHLRDLRSEIENIKNSKKEDDINRLVVLKETVKSIETIVNEETGNNFITTNSPVYLAKDNGILELLPHQGGVSNIKLTQS